MQALMSSMKRRQEKKRQEIFYLRKSEGIEEHRRALAVADVNLIGLKARVVTRDLRREGIVAYDEDIVIHRLQANGSVVAVSTMQYLVAWSGGLYNPPSSVRSC